MLRTEPMQKVRIVSLDKDRDVIISKLHKMGVIDLRKSSLNLSDDKPAVYSTEVSDALIKVTGALQILSKQTVNNEKHLDVNELIRKANGIEAINTIYRLDEERKELRDDQKSLDYAQHVAESFSDIKIDFGRLKSDYIVYRAFETDKAGAKALKQRANAMGRKIDLNIRKTTKKNFVVMAAYAKETSIDELYKGLKINELDLTAKYIEGGSAEIINNAKKKRAENDKKLSEIRQKLEALSKKHYSELANIKEMLEIELERSEVGSMFKRTESTFVIEGWVRKRQIPMLKAELQILVDYRLFFEELETDELAPTYTNRPGFLKSFDYLVGFYSVQRSDEIDPTWIFILTFPIFYGLMVTDVGYGISSLILATLITKKTSPEGLMYNAAKLWQINALAAIAFGLLSNQWFGFQLNNYVGLTQGAFNWLTNTPELIALTVLFGVFQVVLGLVFGVYNSYHHGHKKLAIARFTSILVVLCGTVAVAGFFFGAFNIVISEINAGIAVVSLLITAVLSGSEATEITNLITHPLSYARLMGFGLGSVIIAYLIDLSFTPNLNSGIIIFIIYAIIFIALHFLNMVLSIFEGIVQGVRLNFVEFFSKFYTGNGIPFSPFKYKRVYTKENET